jgi:hypothetical protein
LTDGTGSTDLCRHGLGNSGDKVCFSLKKQDAETCGVNHRGDLNALEPNTLYIMAKYSPTRQAFPTPRLDTTRLATYYVSHLRDQTHDLNEWYRLFALINLTLNNFEGTIDLSHVEQQERRLEQPLQTPARTRTRGLHFDHDDEDDPGEEEHSPQDERRAASSSAWEHIPETPVMSSEGFSTQEERDDWVRPDVGLPSDLVRTIHSLQRGLEENANNLIVMHREVSSRWLLLADDLKLLSDNQTLLQSQMAAQATSTREETGLTGIELQALAERITKFLNDMPAAEARVTQLEAAKTTLETKNRTLELLVASLTEQLETTLAIVLSLRDAPQGHIPSNPLDLTGSASPDLSTIRTKLANLESDILGLKAHSGNLGTVKAFSDIIPNIQSVKDVEAWLTMAFRDPDGEGNPYHENRAVGEYLPQDDIPTFGPFSDIYVILAVCEELEGTVTKGETLKERDLIEKAGLNHPGESTVIYALKHTIPNFLSRGSANPRQTALRAVKTAADWDQVFNKEMAKGLKDVWDERQPDVEAVIRGHIEDSLSRHGHLEAASLAREMLAKSCKFTNKVFEYLTNLNRELTDRSGFPLGDAWLLSTEIVARICKSLNTTRSEVRDISIKSTPIRNTARILYAMLRVHDVMDEYMKLEIKNHPSISSEYVKFLAAHATFKEVQGLKKKFEMVEKRLPELDKEFKKLSDTVKTTKH